MNRPVFFAVFLLGLALTPAPAHADRFAIGFNLGAPGISIGGVYGGHHLTIPFQVSVPLGYVVCAPAPRPSYVYRAPARVVARPRTVVVRPYATYSSNYVYVPDAYVPDAGYPCVDDAYGYAPYGYYPYGYFTSYNYSPSYSYYPYGYDRYPVIYNSGYTYSSYSYPSRYRGDQRALDRDDRRDFRNDRDRDGRGDDRDRVDRNDRTRRDSRDIRRDSDRTQRSSSTQPSRTVEKGRTTARERFDSFRPQSQQARPATTLSRTAPRSDGGFIAERSRTLSITRSGAPGGHSDRTQSSAAGRAGRATNADGRSGGR